MTENVNFSVNSITNTIDSAMHKSSNAVHGRDDRAEKPATHQSSPDVAITELANKAAVGRQESLNSINEVTEELRDAINTLNAALEKTKTRAIITRDEEINRFIVRIADQESGEIVREIPSEAILKFARNLQELKGLIFDKSL